MATNETMESWEKASAKYSTDDLIHSLWNRTLEQEHRIEALEKAEEHTKRRFMEVEDTPVYQMALINELRDAHDVLCDVLESVICDYIDREYGGRHTEQTDEMLFGLVKARIPTDGQRKESNGEPQDSEDATDGESAPDSVGEVETPQIPQSEGVSDSSQEVDAQLERLRVIARQRYVPDYAHRTVQFLDSEVRPILEQWAQKVADLERSNKSFGEECYMTLNEVNDLKDEAKTFQQQRKELIEERERERQRAEKAENTIAKNDKNWQQTVDAMIAERAQIKEKLEDTKKDKAKLSELLTKMHSVASENEDRANRLERQNLKLAEQLVNAKVELETPPDNAMQVENEMAAMQDEIDSLRKDKARLDWLGEQRNLSLYGRGGTWDIQHDTGRHGWTVGESWREAIDNAKGGE